MTFRSSYDSKIIGIQDLNMVHNLPTNTQYVGVQTTAKDILFGRKFQLSDEFLQFK